MHDLDSLSGTPAGSPYYYEEGCWYDLHLTGLAVKILAIKRDNEVRQGMVKCLNGHVLYDLDLYAMVKIDIPPEIQDENAQIVYLKLLGYE